MPLNGVHRSRPVNARIFRLIYLAVIAVAMIGWSWIIFQGLAWALDI